ncbi:hypothetical protein TNCV_3861351 [Trichonephila clavipes]|nr:hypothetical protein TNCV_3861351 [Trichonephila clavipes]
MFDPSPFAIPTPLAHADTSRDVLPRGGTSQTHFETLGWERLYHPQYSPSEGALSAMLKSNKSLNLTTCLTSPLLFEGMLFEAYQVV